MQKEKATTNHKSPGRQLVHRLSRCPPIASQKRSPRKLLSRVPGACVEVLTGQIPEIEREDRLSFVPPPRSINAIPPHPSQSTHETATTKHQWCKDTLDIIDINLLNTLPALITTITLTPILIELKVAISISLLPIRIGLIDLRALGQFAVSLQAPGLVGAVLQDDVSLLVLVVTQREQDDVTLVDPDFLPELAADMGEALGAVEAEGFETAVSEHLEDLRVFCRREVVS